MRPRRSSSSRAERGPQWQVAGTRDGFGLDSAHARDGPRREGEAQPGASFVLSLFWLGQLRPLLRASDTLSVHKYTH
jgi:hypothetical protein